MQYSQEQVRAAYAIYRQLYVYGSGTIKEWKEYVYDEQIRSLMEEFAHQDEAAILNAGEVLYLVPLVSQNNMQLSNEYIKKFYMNSDANNIDLYMMYFCTIIFIGKFYDSYESIQATRGFMTIEEWLESVNERIELLAEIDEAVLVSKEKELEYNWTKIIDFWLALDHLKENVKRQTGKTKSRVSFLNMTKSFLEKQGLVEDLGNDELNLTDKAQDIIQKYYMEYEYNRGILDFLYGLTVKEDN
ncbi:MAG: DUF6063 family protein [Cellulosilyticaceae bacterium]